MAADSIGCAPQQDEASERNFLHAVADDIRERGVVGSAVNAVRENPLLLLPGGTILTFAHRGLSGGCGSWAGNGAEAAAQNGATSGFDIASALDPGLPTVTSANECLVESGDALGRTASPLAHGSDPGPLVEAVASGEQEPEAAASVAAMSLRGAVHASGEAADHELFRERLATALRDQLSCSYLGLGRHGGDPDEVIFRLLAFLCQLRAAGELDVPQRTACEASEELMSLMSSRDLASHAAPLLQELRLESTHSVVAHAVGANQVQLSPVAASQAPEAPPPTDLPAQTSLCLDLLA